MDTSIYQQGILNSNYKNLAKQNFSKNENDVFGIKQHIKSAQHQHTIHLSGMIKFGFALIIVATFL